MGRIFIPVINHVVNNQTSLKRWLPNLDHPSLSALPRPRACSTSNEKHLENTACSLDECGIRRILISIKKPRSKQACSGLFYTYLMLLIANAQLLDDSSNTA